MAGLAGGEAQTGAEPYAMLEQRRWGVDEFFDWLGEQEGIYELVDGRIVPHPDYVTPLGLAAPVVMHGVVAGNIFAALRSRLRPPCFVSVTVGVEIDRKNGNVPDLAVSCSPADLRAKKMRKPRYIVEVLSPSTRRTDRGAKVEDYLRIPSLRSYLVVDIEAKAMTAYTKDGPPLTAYERDRVVRLDDDLELPFAEVFAIVDDR